MAGTYASKPIECRICVSMVYKDKNENVQANLVIKPLTKELPESIRDFAAHMPANNCIFWVKERNTKGGRYFTYDR
jgi:hypothetical protein